MRHQDEDATISADTGNAKAWDGLPVTPLKDIDAWNIRRQGDWLHFDACLPPFGHTRAYRRPVGGGDVIADAQGPLLAVLTIGGHGAAVTFDERPEFARHVVTPGDGLGLGGAYSASPVISVNSLQTLTESTEASLLAEALIATRVRDGLPVPVIAARAETDGSHTMAELGSGAAMTALSTTIDNLIAAARTLERPLRILAFTVDFGAEDVATPPEDFANDTRGLIDQLTGLCASRNIARPEIVLRCGHGPLGAERPWLLAAYPAGQRTLITTPDYVIGQSSEIHLNSIGPRRRAALDAAALESVAAGHGWACPLPLLAERADDGRSLTVLFSAMEPLVLDPDPPFPVPANLGFAFDGDDGSAITGVALSKSDDRAIVVETDRPLPSGAVLTYAIPGTGAVRDGWQHPHPPDDIPLHRWALPARLTVR